MTLPGLNTLDTAAPADNSEVPLFSALYRADKAAIVGVLGTLSQSPNGTQTTGWREVQVNDDSWLCRNLNYSGGQWLLDNIAKAGLAVTLELSGPYVRIMYAPAGSNPVTPVELARFTIAGAFSMQQLATAPAVPVPGLLLYCLAGTVSGQSLRMKGTDGNEAILQDNV